MAKKQIIEINYWKYVNNKFMSSFEFDGNVSLAIYKSLEFTEIVEFINKIPFLTKILYVSFTKTYDSVKNDFKELKPNIFMIDCVSSQLFTKEPEKDCIFLPEPKSLYELVDIIKDTLSTINIDFIIIDSISQFNISYNNREEYKKLLDIKSTFKKLSSVKRFGTIFFFDEHSALTKHIPFNAFDYVLKIEVLSESLPWE
jgi:hypothetical protein